MGWVLLAVLALGCDDAEMRDAGPAEPDAAVDAGAVVLGDSPSASFLIDEGAADKDVWPEHPLTACVLELARARGADELEAQIGLAPAAAGAIVALRGDGLDSLGALDAIPHVGPVAFERLLTAARATPGCACDGAACGVDPRVEQREELLALLAYLRDRQGNATDLGVDEVALTARVDGVLARGAGTPVAYLVALRAIMLAFPNGHSGVIEPTAAPSSGLPYAYLSPWGACARPHARGFVITHAQPSNPLGLTEGDLVVDVDGRGGDALVDWLLAQPAWGPFPASESARRHIAGLMLMSTLRAGAALAVEAPDGSARELLVPDRTPAGAGVICSDPFARDTARDAYASRRDDGVAVIRLPNLVPSGVPAPTDPADVPAYMQTLVDRIAEAYAMVRDDATAVVWDMRANAGGISPVGFAIIQGFLSTRAGELSMCESRQPGTDTFFPAGGEYEIAPGGVVRFDAQMVDVGDVFTADVPTAVLVDGLSGSAADYFALATRRFTDAWLVGAPTLGGYGSATLRTRVGAWEIYSDALRCVDADGALLEGYGVEVDLTVDYDPVDLAAGRDTVLEAAVTQVLACDATDCAP